jgi:hypothetical protein
MDTTCLAADSVPDNFLASKVWKCGNICARATETEGFILRQRCLRGLEDWLSCPIMMD